jgi:hypothetical protein
MAKPKNATALYEVIRKAATGERGAGGRVSDAEANAGTAQLVLTDESQSAGAEQDYVSPPEMPASEGTPVSPVLQMADGQVRLALSPVLAAVVIFAFVCLMVVAYWTGVRIGESRGHDAGFVEGRDYANAAALDEIQEARAKPPAEGLFKGVGVTPVRRTDTTSATGGQRNPGPRPGGGETQTGWVPGYTYIVVQDFRTGDRPAMEQARRFLLENGIETAVIELSGQYVGRLITTQGFNWEDPVQKQLYEDYLARVRELGQAFFENGGKYRLQGYPRTLKAETW